MSFEKGIQFLTKKKATCAALNVYTTLKIYCELLKTNVENNFK